MHLVLLPGLGGSAELFEPLVEAAPEGFTCSVASYPNAGCLSYPEAAQHILDHHLPDGRYLLVGESYSGPVSVLAGSRRPQGLAGIVLCNSFVVAPAWRGLRHLPWPRLMGLPVNRWSAGYFLVGFDRTGEWLGPIRRAHRAVETTVLAHRLRSTLDVDVRKELDALEVPVMYLRGEADRLVGSGSLATVVACRPSTHVARIDGPHLLLQTRPEASWRAIAEFVSKLCAV